MSAQKISFASEPDDRVPAWLLIPDNPNGTGKTRRPAVLCLHQTIAIGKDEPAGLGTNPDLAYAPNWPSEATSRLLPITRISVNTGATSTPWDTPAHR